MSMGLLQANSVPGCNGSVTAERRAPALRDHEKLGRAELELCAPSAVTETHYDPWIFDLPFPEAVI